MKSTLSAPLSDLQLTTLPTDPLGLDPIPEDPRQRFLRFSLLAEAQVFLSLKAIVEVRQLNTLDILPIPEISNSLLGVCNWRGDLLWLADLNALISNRPLLQETTPHIKQPMVIVVQSNQKTMGLVVAQVDDIELIDPQDIQPQTDLGTSALGPYGVGYLHHHQGTVLDADVIIERLCH